MQRYDFRADASLIGWYYAHEPGVSLHDLLSRELSQTLRARIALRLPDHLR